MVSAYTRGYYVGLQVSGFQPVYITADIENGRLYQGSLYTESI